MRDVVTNKKESIGKRTEIQCRVKTLIINRVDFELTMWLELLNLELPKIQSILPAWPSH